MITLNSKDDGYRGIWYMNQPSGDEYAFKYSGGLGTYCAKHQPFAVYSHEARKTFFCYGGAPENNQQRLLHMVSYYDHATGMVPRPTILLDKETDDAHDNPVISLDACGHVWIFSTSHGTGRPSYIHRSRKPYDVDAFELISATREANGERVPFTNFSYMQVWNLPEQGFASFLTHYNDPAVRTSFFAASHDGINWSEWQRIAAIQEGHYQISAATSGRAGTAFNFHPEGKKPGLNWRTNLYYIETPDLGTSWQTAAGESVEIPLTQVNNPALVCDYQARGLNVYLKDIQFDDDDRPVILYLTSRGYEAGPENSPRVWTTARWDGAKWNINPAMQSDNNYDMGSLYIEGDGRWRIIAPTKTGPQPFNPGGEIEMWISEDHGATWSCAGQLTRGSERNHTYVRRPVHAHPDFYALWADGHARKPSPSRIYFCDREGNARILPDKMESDFARPVAAADAS